MYERIKKAFDPVELDRRKNAQMREKLLRLQQCKEEELMHKHTMPRKLAAVLAIIATILALTLVSYAATQGIRYFTGASIQYEKTDDGGVITYGQFDTDKAIPPAKVVNGKLIFTLDGSSLDITDLCSETEYYRYDSTDPDGYRHTLIIGGTPEDWGYAEYIWLDHCRSGHISVKGEKPQWLINAEAELNSEF